MIPRATPPWWNEEGPKLRELMQAKEWAPSTPTPPNGSRKASSSDSVLSPPDISMWWVNSARCWGSRGMASLIEFDS